MNISFILVEPGVPENVGASARALKTMGFNQLIVINSRVQLQPEARWVAHGSAEVLDNIKVFDTLGEAVEGMDLVIGTTAKKRRVNTDYYSCSDIRGLVMSKSGMIGKLAIVFGREASGLSNDELRLCNILSGIPMQGEFPSLNLSQSVMIYAWEMSQLRNKGFRLPAKRPARAKLSRLRKMAGGILRNIGYSEGSAVYSRIMERIEAMGDKDAGLLMSVCSKFDGADY
jgi:tRNA/rRNA methyltransferase